MTDIISSNLPETMAPALGLVPILPLCGAVLLALMIPRPGDKQGISGWLATFFALSAFGVAVSLFVQLNSVGGSLTYHFWNWFSVESAKPLHVAFALRFDRLASVMTLIITGVGSLIHLYSIGYMAHDPSRARFFCYLNLFLFAMLLLVLGDNLLVLFVGWEGVGLCSYLLIGFWYTEMNNAIAGQKAFVVNRIGDAGFLLGIFTLFMAVGTINFPELHDTLSRIPASTIEIAAFLLFIGAVGKSAQIPLYVWLPDAMAGPTPVSALIHAATMVTAGIYMITRLSFLYVLAPHVLVIVSVIGTMTAFFAATVAIAQTDIKKVLAYSTVSQLGYMFMALGAGAFSNGIFHVVTHAFFKACLFMAAGSVIMGCHHEQDMRHFGGLWKKMPLTFLTYLVATFAISGFPGLSGFYSKDAILWSVYSNPGLPSQIIVFGTTTLAQLLWGFGAATASLTAFYMTRSLIMTFFGTYRGHAHPHESPWQVTVPLLILAGLSAVFGFIFREHFMEYLAVWARPDMLLDHETMAHAPGFETLEVVSIVMAVSGMAISAVVYLFLPQLVASVSRTFSFLHRTLINKWWVDELYQFVIIRGMAGLANFLFTVVDRVCIDGTVNGAGYFVDMNGEVARRAHTGRTALYALLMFVSSIFLTVFWLLL